MIRVLVGVDGSTEDFVVVPRRKRPTSSAHDLPHRAGELEARSTPVASFYLVPAADSVLADPLLPIARSCCARRSS